MNSNKENTISKADQQLAELARMAFVRHNTACPNVDNEWTRIESRLQECPPTDKPAFVDTAPARKFKLWAIVATAAAAVLAFALIFVGYKEYNAEDVLVALDYDDKPQQITLTQDDSEPINLYGQDSITYYNKVKTPANKQGKQQCLSTPRGMDFKVILPDGSEVWLNAESTIKFPSAFQQGERRVELQGEAYFKVTHNAQHPFIVTTDRMNVRVLGTEFNMRNYKKEAPRVTLVKGSVKVMNPKKGDAWQQLVPGQDAWCDKEGTVHVTQGDTYSVTQWVEGFFYFDNMSLVSILRELGRWYNLGVVFQNTTAAEYKLHFSASRKDNIQETLTDISQIANVNISIQGTDIVVK